MTDIITGGMVGLLMGIAMQLCGLTSREKVRGLMAWSRTGMVRVMLMALGLAALLTSVLAWLAVIDVDMLVILPLDGGTILGGLVFGAAAAWVGATPGTALSGIGGGRFLESLCVVAGCLVGGVCLSLAEPLFDSVRQLIPASASTWFRVTLDKPYLFSGGFLGQGCIGLVLLAASLCLRPERAPVPSPAEPVPEPEPIPEPSSEPADVQDETFVAILPGEEPVVVDTAAPKEPAQEPAEKPAQEPAAEPSRPPVEEPAQPPAEDPGPAPDESMPSVPEPAELAAPPAPDMAGQPAMLPGELPLLPDAAALMSGDGTQGSAIKTAASDAAITEGVAEPAPPPEELSPHPESPAPDQPEVPTAAPSGKTKGKKAPKRKKKS